MATHDHTTPRASRRALLGATALVGIPTAAAPAGAPQPPVIVPPPADPGPDAETVRLARDFIAAEIIKERKMARFYDLAPPWSDEDEAEYRTFDASVTRYHERMGAITHADVTTPAGLLAQAEVLLWHTKHPSGGEADLWNLADSVFRVCGQPLPAWVSEFDE